MTKAQLEAEITKVKNNQFLPQVVKDLKIKKLTEEFEKAGPKEPAKKAKHSETGWDAKNSEVTNNGKKVGNYNFDEDSDSFWVSTESGDKSFDTKADLIKYFKDKTKGATKEPAQKKKPKYKPKQTKTFKGKRAKELTDEECDELRRAVRERRDKAAKSEKKSKSKPIIEKVAANVATAVKQAVKNVSAEDIKANPKKEINKFERIEKAAKAFLAEMRSILGEDYDKDSIDDEFKDIKDLIKELKKKYQ